MKNIKTRIKKRIPYVMATFKNYTDKMSNKFISELILKFQIKYFLFNLFKFI